MEYIIEIADGMLIDFRIEHENGEVERPEYKLIDHDIE